MKYLFNVSGRRDSSLLLSVQKNKFEGNLDHFISQGEEANLDLEGHMIEELPSSTAWLNDFYFLFPKTVDFSNGTDGITYSVENNAPVNSKILLNYNIKDMVTILNEVKCFVPKSRFFIGLLDPMESDPFKAARLKLSKEPRCFVSSSRKVGLQGTYLFHQVQEWKVFYR